MESISWQQQLTGGDNYLKRARKNSSSYAPDLLYNLCAMAIEQYFMALCVYKDVLPENHRFTDLVDAVVSFTPIDETIVSNLKKMETMQEICSLEAYSRKKSTPEEVPFYIETTESVRNFVLLHIPSSSQS